MSIFDEAFPLRVSGQDDTGDGAGLCIIRDLGCACLLSLCVSLLQDFNILSWRVVLARLYF